MSDEAQEGFPVPEDGEPEGDADEGDSVQEAGEESFPASDPPSSWAGE